MLFCNLTFYKSKNGNEKQGLKNGWIYSVDVSYLVRSGYMNINEEYVKEWEHSKLKGNNNENDTLKPE